MTRKLIIALAAGAVFAPLAAQAQDSVSSTVSVTGDVGSACVVGQPSTVTLTLGDLTGPDGRISATMASSTVAATTSIETAWCNAPSTLSLDGAPMALVNAPSYASPTGFSRLVTYDATLTGWPTVLVDRPTVGSVAQSTTAAGAHAETLVLDISALTALDAAGTGEAPLAVLEAGAYSGSVVISAAANP